MVESNPYLILNVGRQATTGQIIRSYRSLAKIYHPDINERTSADERMQQINWAYELLSDPVKRAKYDSTHTTVNRLDEQQRYGRSAWRIWENGKYYGEWNKTGSSGPWQPPKKPNAPIRMPYGVDRLAIGVATSSLILVASALVGEFASIGGGLLALLVGVAVASMPDRKLSGQNGAAVGAIVTFLFTASVWPSSVDGIIENAPLSLFIWAGAAAVVLGIPIGAFLGRAVSWVRH